jgi:hypothetical protein
MNNRPAVAAALRRQSHAIITNLPEAQRNSFATARQLKVANNFPGQKRVVISEHNKLW